MKHLNEKLNLEIWKFGHLKFLLSDEMKTLAMLHSIYHSGMAMKQLNEK